MEIMGTLNTLQNLTKGKEFMVGVDTMELKVKVNMLLISTIGMKGVIAGAFPSAQKVKMARIKKEMNVENAVSLEVKEANEVKDPDMEMIVQVVDLSTMMVKTMIAKMTAITQLKVVLKPMNYLIIF